MPDSALTTDRTAALEALRSAAHVQFIVMIAMFIALPILVYGILRIAEAERGESRSRSSAERAALIAKALAPSLEQARPADAEQVTAELKRFQDSGLGLNLYFRPPSTLQQPASVFHIAEVAALGRSGAQPGDQAEDGPQVSQRIVALCEDRAPGGVLHEETAARSATYVRVRAAQGCWVVAAQTIGARRYPLWSTPALQLTGIMYLGMVLFTLGSAVRTLVMLRRVGAAEQQEARDPALQTAPERGDTPPIDTPPLEIPPLQAEPSGARAEKQPLAQGTAAPEPMGDSAPGLLDAARGEIDLSALVAGYLDAERNRFDGAGERLVSRIEEGIAMTGRADFIRSILTELIGGALGGGGTVEVTLTATRDEDRRRAILTVHQSAATAGEIGRLPYIKQFVAALGAVSAETREGVGVTVRVAFPG